MLALTRKKGESIILNDNTTITVVHLTSKQVRLSFDAPPEVIIRRAELTGPWHRKETQDASS